MSSMCHNCDPNPLPPELRRILRELGDEEVTPPPQMSINMLHGIRYRIKHETMKPVRLGRKLNWWQRLVARFRGYLACRSFERGWRQAQRGETRPVSELWDD